MAVRLWQVVAQYTYIYSASDHEFLPNGTRRGPWVVAVDNVRRPADTRPTLFPRMLFIAREQHSQIQQPIARPISLRQSKRIATRSHSYRTQEVQGRKESRQHNVDADDLRNDYADMVPLARTMCHSPRRC
jgi:hypothetical protein